MVKRTLAKIPPCKKQTTEGTLRARTIAAPRVEIPQGLVIHPNIIPAETLAEVMADIDCREWDTRFTKRMQHYGYFFNHLRNRLEPAKPFDGVFQQFVDYLQLLNLSEFNMCSVEEYLEGNFRSFSIESLRYGAIAAILNLGDPVTFTFRRRGYENHIVELPGSSLMILAGEARTFWQHRIEPLRPHFEEPSNNARRIQLTFRQVPGDQI